MSLEEELDKLKLEYVNEVLPHLFKSTTSEKISNSLSGISNGTFSFSLGIESIIECAPEYKAKGNRFVHFTSISVLQSIINTQVIRMYNLKNVNDPKEFELIAKEFGYNKFQIDLFKERIYIFSMCHSDVMNSNNILNLWRLYGSNGNGRVIEFEIDERINNLSYIKLANIIYKKPSYTDFFEANKLFEEKNNRKVKIKDLIKLPACLHKSPLYEVENEIRLVYEDGFTYYENVFDSNSMYSYDINGKGDIVSYYDLPLNKDHIGMPGIRVKSIEIGFKISKEKFKEYKKHIELLYHFLNKNSKDDIETPEVRLSPLIGIYN